MPSHDTVVPDMLIRDGHRPIAAKPPQASPAPMRAAAPPPLAPTKAPTAPADQDTIPMPAVAARHLFVIALFIETIDPLQKINDGRIERSCDQYEVINPGSGFGILQILKSPPANARCVRQRLLRKFATTT
nr:hypothetical protein [Phytoactinopolyspora alkaliphila]